MSDVLDQAGGVREGEELDPRIIGDYIKTVVPDISGDPDIRQFPGGASNLTYAVRFSNREFILRRPPFGTKAKSAHDMGREYKVMSKLKPVYPYVPEMIAFCAEQDSPLGCEFYIMERLVGIIPRADMPAGLALSPDQNRTLCENVIDRLVELHGVDYKAAGLDMSQWVNRLYGQAFAAVYVQPGAQVATALDLAVELELRGGELRFR